MRGPHDRALAGQLTRRGAAAATDMGGRGRGDPGNKGADSLHRCRHRVRRLPASCQSLEQTRLGPPTALESLTNRGRLRTAATLFGPAFVASVAYVDPGNFATNFAAGAAHGYRLLWVILVANGCVILVQYATAKLGLATGQNLPEICAQRYSRRTTMLLWAQADIVAMATDVAELVGAALGLHLLFGIALLPAGLITAPRF